MASDRLSDETKDLILKAYAYVEDSREPRHLAAAVAFFYNSSLHGSCPAAAPRSNLARDARINVPWHYNNPRGMKPLNSMLRHAFNYFYDIQRKFNFDDYEARAEKKNVVFFRARSLCATISEVFSILVESSYSRSKDEVASRLFRQICDYCYRMPRTIKERRAADEEERRREEAAAAVLAAEEAKRAAAVKVIDDAARAEADKKAQAAGFASAEDVW